MSVVGVMLLCMLRAEDLVAAYDAGRPDTPTAASGFPELDSLTGGIIPGRVWILVGAPGQGRSTLVSQWAAAVTGQRDQAVHVVTPRDSPSTVATRLLSLLGRVPLSHLTSRRLDSRDVERLHSARDELLALNLSLFANGDDAYVPEADAASSQEEPTAVFIDDADTVSGVTPQWVAAVAAAGAFVLVSMPRHHVVVAPDDEADLEPAWARVADVVLEVRHRGLPNGALRPGEAELHLRYNRWGYLRTIPALHQAHFARFVETTSS